MPGEGRGNGSGSGYDSSEIPIEVSGEAEQTSGRELGTGVQLRRRTGWTRGCSLMEGLWGGFKTTHIYYGFGGQSQNGSQRTEIWLWAGLRSGGSGENSSPFPGAVPPTPQVSRPLTLHRIESLVIILQQQRIALVS